ncbi:MAG TPA: tyrosine-protein phosphatase [Acidimicrobiales bacterium]|nr:tyrosine-protein phosphatase [Acidimicrobiales bacterium]
MSERRVALEGNMNLRDLGGYVGLDGRTVRWGLVFRSDALHALTAADIDVVRGLGLRAVFDLRRTVECERQPTIVWSEDVRIVRMCVGDDAEHGPELIDLIMSGELPEADDQFVVDLYTGMLTDAAPVFGGVLSALADDGGLPALFHCMAGKDRTGLVSALLLTVLGVDRETVLDDYCLTNEYRSNRRIEEMRPSIEAAGVDVEKVRPFLSARRPVLTDTLSWIDATHGGVEAYLTGPAGMSPSTLDVLRARLLD